MTSASSRPRELTLAASSRGRVPASARSALTPARQPFLYMTAALVTGILVDHWLMLSAWLTLPLLAALIAFSVWFVIGHRNRKATMVLLMSFAIAGAMLARAERLGVADTRLKRLFDAQLITPDDPIELTGTLVRPPEPAPSAHQLDAEDTSEDCSIPALRTYYLDVEAESIGSRDETRAATGNVRLMLSLADKRMACEFDKLALDYGSRVRVLVRLERARSYHNPGSRDFTDFLERRGYDLKGVIKSPRLIESLGRAPVNRALAWLYHLRLRIMDALDGRFSPRVAGTLKAMLTGNRYFIDPATTERLREGATFHTLVIAGLHIGILAWALLRFSFNSIPRPSSARRSKSKRPGAIRVVISLTMLWGYAVMVGLAPPVTRAVMMITIGLIGPLFFRRAASINTVALAAFAMLALTPSLIGDPGFQLSFVAVASIVTLALPFIDKLRQIGEWRPTARMPHPPNCSRFVRALAETLFWDARRFDREMARTPIRYRLQKAGAARWLSVLRLQPIVRGAVVLMITSTAIQLATLPLMALYFNRVSPVGVLLNVVAGLLTLILMLAGLAAIIVAPVSIGLGGWCVSLVNLAHHLLINAIEPFLGIPFATFRVAHYEGGWIIIYALYFVPLALAAVLIDRWRPVDQVYPVSRCDERDVGSRGDVGAAARRPEDAVPPSSPAMRPAQLRSNDLPVSSRLRLSVSSCLVAFVVVCLAVVCPPVASPGSKLTIHFLDVGQGDAALIVFPGGSTMLVDGGGEQRFDTQANGRAMPVSPKQTAGSVNDGEEDANDTGFKDSPFSIGEDVVSRFLWAQGRTRSDYVLATHADADHIDGLADVIKNFSVGQALVGHAPKLEEDAEFNHFVAAVKKRSVQLASLHAGERFEIEGVTIEVLWPPRATVGEITSGNDDSVVLRLVYGSVAVLLAGDIEQAAEAALVRSGFDLRADVLKVPHHGSKTSSTDALLDHVRPRSAVISVGERSHFGHPHKAVVERYQSRGIRLFQTGRDGTVTIETDGTQLNVSTYRK